MNVMSCKTNETEYSGITYEIVIVVTKGFGLSIGAKTTRVVRVFTIAVVTRCDSVTFRTIDREKITNSEYQHE